MCEYWPIEIVSVIFICISRVVWQRLANYVFALINSNDWECCKMTPEMWWAMCLQIMMAEMSTKNSLTLILLHYLYAIIYTNAKYKGCV